MIKKYQERTINISESGIIREQLAFVEQYREIKKETKVKTDVIIGDVLEALKILPDEIVDCVVTSPPYWKQRDYGDEFQIGQEETYEEYIEKLSFVFNELKRVLKSTGTFFLNVGYKYFEKEMLLIPELLANNLQKNGWALINKIIWYKPNAMPSSFEYRFSNVYEPIFLFVKKESKYNYYFSLDNLRIPASNFSNNKEPEDILGFEVKNSLLKSKKSEGIVVKVYKNKNGNIISKVKWNDNSETFEIVQDFNKDSQNIVELVCKDCGGMIKNEFQLNEHLNCQGFPVPILSEKIDYKNIEELSKSIPLYKIDSFFSDDKKSNYNGKFKLNPKNRGASPGARKSLFGEYLVLQRRYKVYQPLIARYLRFWRDKRKITIKEIDEKFGYKDTASHWFRMDTGSWGKGGSIPLPDDWIKLKELLDFDDIYDRWVTETHLVLQTVKPHPKGKNPGDVWEIKLQPLTEAHFATFPEELVVKCIEAGCPEGGLVLDPFAGSGTVGKVANELNRNSILIELVEDYLDIIKKRCKHINEIIHIK